MAFRLDPVIDHRRRRTEELELELAALQRERTTGEARIAQLRAELAATRANHGQTGKLDVLAIERVHGYARVIEARIVAEQAAVAELLPHIEAKRHDVMTAHQDQKSLEKLRDREADRLAAEARVGELRQAEEIAAIGFTFRRVVGG